MNRRLRKKKRLGEFREFGFSVQFTLSPDLSDAERNALLRDWIASAIEANGLQFGGGGPANAWEGFVTLGGQRGSATENHRVKVESWLKDNARVLAYKLGPLTDAWHGWR